MKQRVQGRAAPDSTTPPDTEGLEAFYLASYADLVAGLTLVAGSRAEAEDAVQEAFAKLLPRWSRVSAYDEPRAWVRRVALNKLLNRHRSSLRGQRALRRLEQDSHLSDVPTSDHALLDEVQAALAQLPMTQRQVVVLHYVYGLSLIELGEEVDISVPAAKSRLSRAREALRASNLKLHDRDAQTETADD